MISIKYVGSKSRIAKHIVPIIQSYIDQTNASFYLEPFVGGANVIDKISCDKKIGYDINHYILNSVSIKNTHDIEIETLEIDEKFLTECNDGSAQGISYGAHCPILNYLNKMNCVLAVRMGIIQQQCD